MYQLYLSLKANTGKIVLFLLTALFTKEVAAQCPAGSVTLSTQAEVNQFAISYPTCNKITGNLTITGPSDITNLNALSNLDSVTEQLNIVHCNNLTDISGLFNLKSVGNNFWIEDNAALTTINGFNALVTTGQFYIGYNPNLLSINGFSSLTTSGSFSIRNNALLTSFGGFGSLTTSAGINIRDNAELTAFSGFGSLTTITGHLQFFNNAKLQNVNALNSLVSVGGVLNFNANNLLQNINGLSNLTNVGSWAQIYNNAQLQNIDGLNKLTNINGALNISNNTILQNVNGLSKLTNINGYLQFRDNAQLQNIDSLHKLTQIAGFLYIGYNAQLQHVNGLRSLQNIAGYCTFERNAQLQNLDSLSKLTQVGQYIYIDSNTALIRINGLRNTSFTTYNGYGLTIKNNELLAVCNIPNFCTYLANPGNTHLRDISGNLANCLNEAAVVAACTAPSIIFVKADATGANNGTSWADAYIDLQHAINSSDAGDSIFVAAGTYKPRRPADNLNTIDSFNKDNAFVIKPDIKIYGGFAGTESSLSQRDLSIVSNKSTLSGDYYGDDLITGNRSTLSITGYSENTYHVVISSGNVGSATLDGFTITGGNATGSGNILVYGNTISRQHAGGVIVALSQVLFRNLILSGNTGNYGGGMFISAGEPRIYNSKFQGNVSISGGGVKLDNSLSRFYNVLIAGNSVTTYGAGADIYGTPSPEFTNTTISGNYATTGGGICSNYSYPQFKNSVIWGNNTEVENLTPLYTINYFNSVVKGDNSIYGQNGNLQGTADPLFINAIPDTLAPFTNGNYNILAASNAINAGTVDTTGLMISAIDLAGTNRMQGSRIDIGAYELPFYYSQVNGGNFVVTNMNSERNGTGSQPGSFDIVAAFTIQTGHQIYIPSPNLNLSNSALFIENSANIEPIPRMILLGGTFSNNGSVKSIIVLYGLYPQNIYGIGSVRQLTLNNAAGATIASGSKVFIQYEYKPQAGVLTTNDGLILACISPTQRGYIMQGTGNYINGNVTIETCIPAKAARKWSFIASPVSGTIHNTWQQQIHITGAGTGGTVCPTFTPHSNGFDATGTNASNIFTYDASQISGSRWQTPVSTLLDNVEPGKGFRINIRGDRTLGCSLLDGSPSGLVPGAVTLRATGDMSNASKNLGSFGITYPNSGINNYVLVGNPYPSPISFSNLQASNNSSINNIYAIYIPASPTGVYSYWDGTSFTGGTGYYNPTGNTIAINQAFFVQSSVAGNLTLNFEESHKTFLNYRGYYRTTNFNEKLKIAYLQNNATQMDEVVIRYANDAGINNTDQNHLDIVSMNSGSNYITSLKGTNGMVVQTRNLQTLTSDTVRLNVVSTNSGNYKLQFTEFENFVAADIYLIDHYTNTTHDVKQNTMYEFSVDKDIPETKGANRFSVVFNKKLQPELTWNSIKLYPNPAKQVVTIQLPNNVNNNISYTIKVTDVTGKTVMQQKTNGNTEQLNINKLSKGTYIVEIIDSKGNRATEKLVKS